MGYPHRRRRRRRGKRRNRSRIRGNETTLSRLQNVDRDRLYYYSRGCCASRGHPVYYLHNDTRPLARSLTHTRARSRACVQGKDARHWTVKAERAKGTRNAKGCASGGEGTKRGGESRSKGKKKKKRRAEDHIPWTVIPNAANKSNRSINPPPLHIFVNIAEG